MDPRLRASILMAGKFNLTFALGQGVAEAIEAQKSAGKTGCFPHYCKVPADGRAGL